MSGNFLPIIVILYKKTQIVLHGHSKAHAHTEIDSVAKPTEDTMSKSLSLIGMCQTKLLLPNISLPNHKL